MVFVVFKINYYIYTLISVRQNALMPNFNLIGYL